MSLPDASLSEGRAFNYVYAPYLLMVMVRAISVLVIPLNAMDLLEGCICRAYRDDAIYTSQPLRQRLLQGSHRNQTNQMAAVGLLPEFLILQQCRLN